MKKTLLALCFLLPLAPIACGEDELAADGDPCDAPDDCADGLVCTDYQGGMCLRRCDPNTPDACGEGSWCTIASGPEPGLKCTPPAP